MDWTIKPGIGIGPLRFGMTPQEVLRAAPTLGPAQHSDREFDGSLRESRGIALPQLSYADDRLRDVETSPSVADVRFEELDVFADEPEAVARRLYARNGGALAGLGDLLFLNLGVNTGGFFDPETGRFKRLDDGHEDYRTLTVFAPGAFDALLDDLQPIALPTAR